MLEMEAKGEKALRVQKEVLMVPRIQKVGQKVQNCQILEKEAKGEKVPRDQTIMERMLEMEAKGEKALRVQKETLRVLRDQKMVDKILEKDQKVLKVQEEIQGKILEKFLHLVLLAQTLKLLYVLDHALVNLEIRLKDSQLMVL